MSTISVTLGTNVFKVEDDGGNASPAIIQKSAIDHVGGVFIANPVRNKSEGFPFDTVTKLIVYYGGEANQLPIELQNVSNQGTWNGGTKADLDQAIADIEAWL